MKFEDFYQSYSKLSEEKQKIAGAFLLSFRGLEIPNGLPTDISNNESLKKAWDATQEKSREMAFRYVKTNF